MIRHPRDCWPAPLLEEYRRLARLPFSPIAIMQDPDRSEGFKCKLLADTALKPLLVSGQEYAGTAASVAWLKNGPKIVNVTEEQWQALSRVEVRLEVKDFSMPFPTILVNMPPRKLHRYVILHTHSFLDLDKVGGVRDDVPIPQSLVPFLIGCSISHDNQHDIVTLIRNQDGYNIEESLEKFGDDVSEEEAVGALQSLRVACNMALAMSNYGYQAEYLFPKEVAQEKKFIAKGNRTGKGGRSASDRLREQPKLLVLDRNVKLYRKKGSREPSAPTGREMPFHWRSGHWHMVPCGVGRTERKRVLYPPCMVRADLLGDVYPDETTTTYSQ